MQHHDQRLEQQRHGPHTQQRLQDHEADKCDRQPDGLLRIAAVGDGEAGQRQDHQHQAAGKVPVHHLLDGLVIGERPLGERLVDGIDVLRGIVGSQVAVAAGPVRTAEAGVAQSHPRSEHDDAESKHDACERQAPEETVAGSHGSLRA